MTHLLTVQLDYKSVGPI